MNPVIIGNATLYLGDAPHEASFCGSGLQTAMGSVAATIAG